MHGPMPNVLGTLPQSMRKTVLSDIEPVPWNPVTGSCGAQERDSKTDRPFAIIENDLHVVCRKTFCNSNCRSQFEVRYGGLVKSAVSVRKLVIDYRSTVVWSPKALNPASTLVRSQYFRRFHGTSCRQARQPERSQSRIRHVSLHKNRGRPCMRLWRPLRLESSSASLSVKLPDRGCSATVETMTHRKLAIDNLEKSQRGSLILIMLSGVFPIHVMRAIRSVPEICRILLRHRESRRSHRCPNGTRARCDGSHRWFADGWRGRRRADRQAERFFADYRV